MANANDTNETDTMPPLSSIPTPIEFDDAKTKADFDNKMRNTTVVGKMPRRETYEKRRKEFDPQTGKLIGERAAVMQERRDRLRPTTSEQSVKAQKEAGTYTVPEPVNQQTLSPSDGFATIEDKEAVAALQGDKTAVEDKKAELAAGTDEPINTDSPEQTDSSTPATEPNKLPSDVVPATDADFIAPIEPVGSDVATEAEKAGTSDASAETPATSAPVDSPVDALTDPAPAESTNADDVIDASSETKNTKRK